MSVADGISRKRAGRRRTTLLDVAELAGVSPVTASRVLRKPELVSAPLRHRVESAMRDLAYIPNQLASALASSRTHTVGVVIPSFTNGVFSDYLRALHDAFLPAGVQVLVLNSRYSAEEEERAVTTLLGQHPEAMIVAGIDQTEHARRLLEDAAIPIVQTMELGESPIDVNIGLSQGDAAYAAARYLLDRGHRHIANMTAPLDARAERRLEGFWRAIDESGIAMERIVATSPSQSSVSLGVRLFSDVLARAPNVDAVFCGNDLPRPRLSVRMSAARHPRSRRPRHHRLQRSRILRKHLPLAHLGRHTALRDGATRRRDHPRGHPRHRPASGRSPDRPRFRHRRARQHPPAARLTAAVRVISGRDAWTATIAKVLSEAFRATCLLVRNLWRQMAFKLRQLQYFVAVAESGSISGAARQLSVSQSAVTEAVQELEEDLGIALLDRSGRGISLTHKGHQFLRHASRILAAVADARRSLVDHIVPVGRTSSRRVLARRGLRPRRSARPFSPRLSGCRGRGGRGFGEYLEHLLVNGELDVAVMIVSRRREHGALEARILAQSAYRLWLPLGHPLAARESGQPRRRRRASVRSCLPSTRSRRQPTPSGAIMAFARRSPFAPARSKPSGALSPPAPASPSCPTSSIARGRSKAIASRLAPTVEALPPVRVGVVWRRGSRLSDPAARFLDVVLPERTE